MKQLKSLSFVLLVYALTAACSKSGPVTTIQVEDTMTSFKIECSGRILFTDDETAIKSISPYGYVTYSRNGRKLKAESDYKGIITYDFYDDDKTTKPDSKNKEFLTDAVKDISKELNKLNRNG